VVRGVTNVPSNLVASSGGGCLADRPLQRASAPTPRDKRLEFSHLAKRLKKFGVFSPCNSQPQCSMPIPEKGFSQRCGVTIVIDEECNALQVISHKTEADTLVISREFGNPLFEPGAVPGSAKRQEPKKPSDQSER